MFMKTRELFVVCDDVHDSYVVTCLASRPEESQIKGLPTYTVLVYLYILSHTGFHCSGHIFSSHSFSPTKSNENISYRHSLYRKLLSGRPPVSVSVR